MRKAKYSIYRLFAILFVFGLTSCQLFSDQDKDDQQPDNLKIQSSHFTDDHKHLILDVNYTGQYYTDNYLTSDSISVNIQELWANGDTLKGDGVPKVSSYKDVMREKFDSINFHPLILVDLTMSQKVVDAERQAVEKIAYMLGENNVYVAFMRGNGVITPTTPLSKYVLSNSFVSDEAKDKHLYKAMLAKLNELGNAMNEVGRQRYKVLMVMSDGAVWGDEKPYDEDHFDSQQALIDYYSHYRRGNMLYFAYFTEEDMADTNDNNLMQMFCQQSKGLYTEQFDWYSVMKDIAHKTYGDYSALQITLEFPDNRIFDGDPRVIDITLMSDSIVEAKGRMEFWEGSIFKPIIVNGKSELMVGIQGFLLGLLIIAVVYVILQFLMPFVLYKLFRRKYVVSYAGPNTTANGKQVADTCYYCKAPFEEGEMVVAKCEHAMHLECWEENDYHCPEHGLHCKDGSHYYNRADLFDSRNTTFYTEWVLLAIVAAILVWISSTHSYNDFVVRTITRIYCYINDLKWDTLETRQLIGHQLSNVYHLPVFTISMGFYMTVTLGFKIVSHYTWNRRILEVAVRALIAGLISMIIYIICGVIVIVTNIHVIGWLFEWIPWFLLILGMGLVHTYNSRIHINLKWLLECLCLSFVLMLLWYFVVTIQEFDYRITIMIIYIVFCVCYAIGIATVAPQSEHYFFRVEGAVKTMDIALYKWFRSSPHRTVTIGKSVDCSLQMSWEINSVIAPVQAQVTLGRKGVYLMPLEEGVYDAEGKEIMPETKVLLRHGTKFRIGQTTFTYIEKD